MTSPTRIGLTVTAAMIATAPGLPNFTGAFVGIASQELAGTAMPADFDWFEYRERAYLSDVSRLETT